MIDFEKTVRVNMLLDFYGNLLTDKQLDTMLLYFKDDLSLQEIASLNQISRNAVYDNIQRTVKQLESYEERLQLLNKFIKRKSILDLIKKEYVNEQKLIEYLKELEELD